MSLKSIKNYAAKLNNSKVACKVSIDKLAADLLTDFKAEKIYLFSDSLPYVGGTRNMIFLTFHAVYKYNSPYYFSKHQLPSAYSDVTERGYIQGVAMDLYTFDILCRKDLLADELEKFTNNFQFVRPKIRRSKHSDDYINTIAELEQNIKAELQKYLAAKLKEIGTELTNIAQFNLLNCIY
jgi:hypothetical protein